MPLGHVPVGNFKDHPFILNPTVLDFNDDFLILSMINQTCALLVALLTQTEFIHQIVSALSHSRSPPHESPFTFSFPELIYRHSTCSGLSPSHSPEYSVTFTPLRFLSFSTPKLKTLGHLHERTLCQYSMKLKRKCESLSLHRASYTWYFKTDKVFGPDVS